MSNSLWNFSVLFDEQLIFLTGWRIFISVEKIAEGKRLSSRTVQSRLFFHPNWYSKKIPPVALMEYVPLN